MKILFLFWNVGTGIASHPGLMTLSALAKREGHETKLWHIRNEKNWDVLLPIDFTPDIVAATATDFEYKHIEKVAQQAKVIWPNAFKMRSSLDTQRRPAYSYMPKPNSEKLA